MLTLPNKMPLPQVLSDAAPQDYVNGMHAGLFYCRFVRGWHPHGKDENNQPKPLSFASYTDGQKKTITPAKDWVGKLHDKKVGDSAMLNAFSIRQYQLVDNLGGKTMCAKTDWHFAIGLGNNHPVENGFAWHPTLGVPYLTGAAVKGLLRAWCEVWLGWKEQKDQRLLQWFGDTSQAGELIFFDALPTGPVTLKADVMTPHMGKWYEDGDKGPPPAGSKLPVGYNIPADWHSPVPVPFLVVAPGQSFLFSVAARPGSTIDLDSSVLKELKKALESLGAGAKTAAGYGRMIDNPAALKLLEENTKRENEEAARRLAEEKALKQMTPFERELYEVAKENSDPNQKDYLTLLKALESNRWTDAEKKIQAARKIKELMESAMVWRPASPKNPKQGRDYQRTLKVMGYLQE
jgi:CRISPR-associated protein Cmr6